MKETLRKGSLKDKGVSITQMGRSDTKVNLRTICLMGLEQRGWVEVLGTTLE
jgi:hypothetical protein